MKKSIAMFVLSVAMAGGALAQGATPQDVASVDAVVAALYDTISGPAGKPRDWERLRALFRPDGKMIVRYLGSR